MPPPCTRAVHWLPAASICSRAQHPDGTISKCSENRAQPSRLVREKWREARKEKGAAPACRSGITAALWGLAARWPQVPCSPVTVTPCPAVGFEPTHVLILV